MAEPQTIRVENLRDFTNLIQGLQDESEGPLWYRGTTTNLHKLQPSLYRHLTLVSPEQSMKLEQDILTRFKQRSLPFLNRQVNGNWDLLFLMQHYGVPTRLLDWSENPFVALYFALNKITHASQCADELSDAYVWILKPEEWNRSALAHLTFNGGILSIDDSVINGYEPVSSLDLMNNEPVAIYGAYNSPRIVAQRGTFVVFGKSHRPMEETFDAMAYPANCLLRVEIPATNLLSIHTSLVGIGIVSSVVFPDLEGLAKELRWPFGFRR